ncbi:MAG: MATE family efflux transporter [Flaviflexus sp.]|nr:MATE family efflux transporter [Flaviflexus sp.]
MSSHSLDRQILQIAVPTLATLLAQPLLVLVDSALVGRLGTVELAGLSLASTILMTIVGVCIFLSYATTAATARYFGAEKPTRAMSLGLDGLWLGAGLGVLLGLILALGGDTIIGWFGPEAAVAAEARGYLLASCWGLPGMLIVLAATGTLRGMLDATTPLKVTTVGALANIPLSYLLIYPAGFGTAGAGLGTATAETGMGIALAWFIARQARHHGVSLLPSGAGVLYSLTESVPLIIRTLCLRVGIIATVAAATALGTNALAAHQIVNATWNFSANFLDSLAIAAQALIGQASGRGSIDQVHTILRRCLVWGAGVGAGLGIVLAAAAPVISIIMTSGGEVRSWATLGLWVCASSLPVAALAYMLDGVLIGAGDTRYLAWMMLASLLIYLPVPLLLLGPWQELGKLGFAILWIGYGWIFMLARALPLYLRTRTDQWIVIGESR